MHVTVRGHQKAVTVVPRSLYNNADLGPDSFKKMLSQILAEQEYRSEPDALPIQLNLFDKAFGK